MGLPSSSMAHPNGIFSLLREAFLIFPRATTLEDISKMIDLSFLAGIEIEIGLVPIKASELPHGAIEAAALHPTKPIIPS